MVRLRRCQAPDMATNKPATAAAALACLSALLVARTSLHLQPVSVARCRELEQQCDGSISNMHPDAVARHARAGAFAAQDGSQALRTLTSNTGVLGDSSLLQIFQG